MRDTLELFSIIFAECGLFLFDQFDDLCDFSSTFKKIGSVLGPDVENIPLEFA